MSVVEHHKISHHRGMNKELYSFSEIKAMQLKAVVLYEIILIYALQMKDFFDLCLKYF